MICQLEDDRANAQGPQFHDSQDWLLKQYRHHNEGLIGLSVAACQPAVQGREYSLQCAMTLVDDGDNEWSVLIDFYGKRTFCCREGTGLMPVLIRINHSNAQCLIQRSTWTARMKRRGSSHREYIRNRKLLLPYESSERRLVYCPHELAYPGADGYIRARLRRFQVSDNCRVRSPARAEPGRCFARFQPMLTILSQSSCSTIADSGSTT